MHTHRLGRTALLVLSLGMLAAIGLAGCEDKPKPPANAAQKPRPQPVANLPHTATSFQTAKQWLYERVYYDHPKTFYCDCDYRKEQGHAGEVDLASCGVQPRKDPKRARRLEAEHVFPAAQFGNFRLCWREPEKVCGTQMSGRRCCEQADPVFEAAHNDLMNLYPAEGEINGDRKDYNWGMIPGNQGEHGACAMQVDPDLRRAEPPDRVKGDVARTMFYMADTYGFRLSNQDRQLFTAWSRMDPPDAWEIERNRRIATIQGKDNKFISQYAALFGQTASPTPAAPASPAPLAPVVPQAAAHREWPCGTKTTCGQMTSCEEAKYYLNTCGVRSLDGNHDGIPCAALCR